MLRSDPWPAILHNNSRSTNPTTITSNVDSIVVVIDINTDKFTKSSCPSELPELGNKTVGMSRQANDSTIDVDDIGIRSVDFCSCG